MPVSTTVENDSDSYICLPWESPVSLPPLVLFHSQDFSGHRSISQLLAKTPYIDGRHEESKVKDHLRTTFFATSSVAIDTHISSICVFVNRMSSVNLNVLGRCPTGPPVFRVCRSQHHLYARL